MCCVLLGLSNFKIYIMRHKVLVLVFFLINILVGFSQGKDKYLATYLEKRVVSAEEIKRIESFPIFLKNKLLKEINLGEEKILFLDNETSFYSLKDDVKKIKEDGVSKQILTLSDYYKDFKNNRLIITRNAGEEEYVIKEKLHPFKWKLINETKMINSMMCKKATSLDFKGREVVAWYTEIIKISNGPFEYGGLPGLIIQLKSKHKSFELKEIKKTNTKEKIDLPSLNNAITMEDFKKKFNQKNSLRREVRYN